MVAHAQPNSEANREGGIFHVFGGGALPSLGKRFQRWSHMFAFETSLVMIGMINIKYSFIRIIFSYPFSWLNFFPGVPYPRLMFDTK